MRPVVDLFGEIVSKVNDSLIIDLQSKDNLITGVHYEHGHILEIINTLTQKDQSNEYRFKKYPLVALLQDFEERNTFEYVEANLNVLIIKGTMQDYTAKQRYDFNFRPFLYPIYKELLKRISKTGYILSYAPQRISHTKIDRVFWGAQGRYGNTAHIGNDFLDAIEIKNLKLKFIKEKCL